MPTTKPAKWLPGPQVKKPIASFNETLNAFYYSLFRSTISDSNSRPKKSINLNLQKGDYDELDDVPPVSLAPCPLFSVSIQD